MAADHQTTSAPARHHMRRLLFATVGLVLLLYPVDFAWYQLRRFVPKLGAAKGSVHRVRLLAIPTKSGKFDFQIDVVRPEEDLPCAHSLFPHGGARPCWYVSRHANDPILM